jgi:hypothetical protein
MVFFTTGLEAVAALLGGMVGGLAVELFVFLILNMLPVKVLAEMDLEAAVLPATKLVLEGVGCN